jgi:hypothetical protein
MSRATAVACLSVGLAVGVLLAPTGALSAVPSLVGISDNGTRVASVTKAHQLLAAESDPANAISLAAGNVGGCVAVYTVPSGKALVLQDATFNVQFVAQAEGDAALYSGPSCGGVAWANEWATGANLTETLTDDLKSQVVLRQGTELDYDSSFAYSYVTVRGYLIPAAAAPQGTHVVSHGSPRPSATPLG